MAKSKTAAFHWSRVKMGMPDECWPWTGSVNRWGYGSTQMGGVSMNASRAAFIDLRGEPGLGLVVCHTCDNPICCNPAHLFAATQAENLADCRAKGRARYRRGAEHHRATSKLTDEQVLSARSQFASGVSQSDIARRYGVHSSTISRAVRGEKWGHLK